MRTAFPYRVRVVPRPDGLECGQSLRLEEELVRSGAVRLEPPPAHLFGFRRASLRRRVLDELRAEFGWTRLESVATDGFSHA